MTKLDHENNDDICLSDWFRFLYDLARYSLHILTIEFKLKSITSEQTWFIDFVIDIFRFISLLTFHAQINSWV